MIGVLRFGRKSKLNPHFIEPCEILDRIRLVAYRLALPSSLSSVHNVFHVSVFHKYLTNPTHVIDYEPLEVAKDLRYEERPVSVLTREVQTLYTKDIAFVKVLWRNQQIKEDTLDTEKYPKLFLNVDTL